MEDSDSEACDNMKLDALYKISWEIQKFATKMSSTMKTQIDNSVKDLLAVVWDTFKKFNGQDPETKLTKEIYKEYEECSTTDFADAAFWTEP